MIRSILVWAAVPVALAAGARAADLPSSNPPAPYVAPPVFTWTGVYLGGNVGAAWRASGNAMALSNAATQSFFDPGATASMSALAGAQGGSARPFIGGAQIGYNRQIGDFVLGAEIDFDAMAAATTGGSGTAVGLAPNAKLYLLTLGHSYRANWLTTARLRFGVAAGRALFYATGGLAFANSDYSRVFSATAGPVTQTSSNNGTSIGWALGGGVEYAFADHWTGKAEILYADAGSKKISAPIGDLTTAISAVATSRHAQRFFVARTGLNYKF